MKYLYILIFSSLTYGLFAQSTCDTAVDLCGSAGPFAGTNVGNLPADDFCAIPACVGADGDFATWYTFVGDGGTYTFNTNGSDFDTQIAILTDNGVGCFACEVGNDDGGVGTQSAATITTVAGVTYFVVVDGFGTNAGNIVLNITDGSGADGDGNPLSIACPSAAEACPVPPPPCMPGFVEVATATYCYDSGEVDAIVTEACPSSPTETVCILVQVGDWEAGFDSVTFYEGAMGSGTGGTVVAGPLDGDVAGTQVCAAAPGMCITMVSNSDGSISCVSGSRPTAEFTICESESVVICAVDLTAPAAANGCDPDGVTGTVFPLDPIACTGTDGDITVPSGFFYDIYLYTPGGVVTGMAAPAGYENTTIPAAAEFPDPLADGNLTPIAVDLLCADVVGNISLANPTCAPATFSFIYFPFSYDLDSDGDLAAEYPTDCQPVRVDYTVYPTLVAEVAADDAANCGDVVIDLYSAGGSANGGSICNSATVACMTDGMATSFTFTEVSDGAGGFVPIVENPDGSCNTLTGAGAACDGCNPTLTCPLGATLFSGTEAPALSTDCSGNPIIDTYTTCTFPGEHNAITGMIPGEEYCFTQFEDGAGVHAYITIIDAADGVTVLASGVSPLCYTATVSDVFIQVNLDDGACGEESTCYDSSVECTTCPGVACTGTDILTPFPCYGDNLVDETLVEVCPENATDVVTITIFETDFEVGFDSATIYSGAMGSGAGGTVVAGPLDGDVSGTYSGNPGECVIIVVNSDGSVSCASGARPAGCYCGPVPFIPDCEANNGMLTIKKAE